MRKKFLISLVATGTALALLPLFAAFEAHVVNVTARIENALGVSTYAINFGTVFPQEKLDQTFDVSLSQSFKDEPRVDDVDYFIRQKPKCWNKNAEAPVFGTVTEGPEGSLKCRDEGFEMLPLLCPYLSKHEITTDGIVQENDSKGMPAFHGPIGAADWTLEVAKGFDVFGHLAKSQQDTSDTWNIDFKVPCFGGMCAQDWEEFVREFNPDANPLAYIQPAANEHELFGCDLWVEVSGISLPGLGCKDQLDMMLVLDRSGSINATELQDLKNAANAFVTALAPTADGVHIGQTSFSTTGSLDLDLTGTEANVHTAINALASGGQTNLMAGIQLATAELDNGHAHERPAVPDVMVILTDGNPNQPNNNIVLDKAAAKAAADAARAAGIEVFVVGIGTDVDAAFLASDIANTLPNPPTHYYSSVDFTTLQTTLQNLVTCTDGTPSPSPTP